MKAKSRKTVSVVTYIKNKNKISYLVLKRTLHWVGWEFPKGGIEKGESALNTVKREIKEETGSEPVKIINHNYSGKYNTSKLKDRPGITYHTYKLYSAEIKNKKIIFDKKEHSSYKWLDFDNAFSILAWPDQKSDLVRVNKYLTKIKL